MLSSCAIRPGDTPRAPVQLLGRSITSKQLQNHHSLCPAGTRANAELPCARWHFVGRWLLTTATANTASNKSPPQGDKLIIFAPTAPQLAASCSFLAKTAVSQLTATCPRASFALQKWFLPPTRVFTQQSFPVLFVQGLRCVQSPGLGGCCLAGRLAWGTLAPTPLCSLSLHTRVPAQPAQRAVLEPSLPSSPCWQPSLAVHHLGYWLQAL